MKTFSFGGGVQSMGAMVLQSQGVLNYDYFLFSNVGEDSENPDTLTYLEQIAKPFAAKHSIELIELHKTFVRGIRKGQRETVYGRAMGENRSQVIPVYLSSGAPGNRSCTKDFKILVIAKWLKAHGATAENPAITGLGISMDEYQRMRTDSGIPHQHLEYPLIDLGLSRRDCVKIIENAGLPVPPKSSCWFCPFKRHAEWVEMRRLHPELFDKAVELEKRINDKALDRDPVRLHPSLNPLENAVGLQYSLFQDEPCDSGYCMV